MFILVTPKKFTLFLYYVMMSTFSFQIQEINRMILVMFVKYDFT